MLNRAIAEKGKARLLMSTGASQFDTIEALRDADVEWDKVEMFHLDEYIGLPETHPASFRKYLKERFLSYVDIRKAHLVNPDNGVEPALELLTREVRAGDVYKRQPCNSRVVCHCWKLERIYGHKIIYQRPQSIYAAIYIV